MPQNPKYKSFYVFDLESRAKNPFRVLFSGEPSYLDPKSM